MREPHPLAAIHDAVLEFLRHRDDVCLFGAHAVNAYVEEARLTQDVDVLSTRASEVARELQASLRERFHIAIRITESAGGEALRIYQVRWPRNRHLVDVRHVAEIPRHRNVQGVPVLSPAELIASKVVGLSRRVKTAKGFQDWADLIRLLLAFPDLRCEEGAVAKRLRALGADQKSLAL